MSHDGCVGYWQSSTGTLAIEETLREQLDYVYTKETIIHELLHALSTTGQVYNDEIHGWEEWCGILRYFGPSENGRGLNEGITEYLAQKLCPNINPDNKSIRDIGSISANVFGAYRYEQTIVNQIAILYGEDKIIDAYFNR